MNESLTEEVAPDLLDDLWQQAVLSSRVPGSGLEPDPDEVWISFHARLRTCGLELTTRPVPSPDLGDPIDPWDESGTGTTDVGGGGKAIEDPSEGRAESLVRAIRCPVHGTTADVHLIPRPSGMFKVDGEMCCDELESRIHGAVAVRPGRENERRATVGALV